MKKFMVMLMIILSASCTTVEKKDVSSQNNCENIQEDLKDALCE